MEASTPAAAAFRVAAFRLLVFAARLRADFSFRFRIAFFAADILSLRMDIPFAVVRRFTRASFTRSRRLLGEWARQSGLFKLLGAAFQRIVAGRLNRNITKPVRPERPGVP
jgi:hypothetical protein